MGLFAELKERGFIKQATHEKEIATALDNKPITFYLGIDPTADSLHIGHFFALQLFRRLQDAGHHGILLIGGATAMIGDPTGKNDMRKMIDAEVIQKNLEEIKELVKHFIKTDGNNPAIIVNNADWMNRTYLDFMRDVGVHFNVNKMLASEVYASRLANGGLSFLEMGYILMQANDFVHLNKTYGCTLQIGGSDQWGNMISGPMLARKMKFAGTDEDSDDESKDFLFCMCSPLLTNKEGKKMGKTEKGTLWVARDKTTVYDFYQYFYNVEDESTEMLLKLFTHIPSAEIEAMCKNDIVQAKKRMAYEVTALVHGSAEADKVVEANSALFGAGSDMSNVPTTEYKLVGVDKVIDVLAATNFLPSKGEARRMIEQGAITIDDEKVSDVLALITPAQIAKGEILVKRGKKNFLKILLKK